jgi:hypothetical protein
MLLLGAVRTGRKACQALTVNISPQRFEASNKHIHSQVKLQPLDEKRILDVARHHHQFIQIQLLDVAEKEDTTAT